MSNSIVNIMIIFSRFFFIHFRKHPRMPVATEQMIYEEHLSRGKLMAGDPDYQGDVIQGAPGDPAMRMSSMVSPRQMHSLPPHAPLHAPSHGFEISHPDKIVDTGGSMDRHPEGKIFQSSAYPTYQRASNHVYETPQFA